MEVYLFYHEHPYIRKSLYFVWNKGKILPGGIHFLGYSYPHWKNDVKLFEKKFNSEIGKSTSFNNLNLTFIKMFVQAMCEKI